MVDHRLSQDALVALAREAFEYAHAPYSRFRVGAAVRTAEGRTFSGSNIENASYGLTICAERVALFTAVAAGATRIAALALVTEQAAAVAEESMPCGACRQVMAEFMDAASVITVAGVGEFTLGQLLPQAFRLRR